MSYPDLPARALPVCYRDFELILDEDVDRAAADLIVGSDRLVLGRALVGITL
jgi:hypothetical protein